jgi:hypothetical protein
VIRILLLGLVLAGVWYLYRMVTQQGAKAGTPPTPTTEDGTASPASGDGEAQPEAEAASSPEPAAPEQPAEAQEMLECPLCHAYVPEGARDGCGRPDCPIPLIAADRPGPGGT